MIFHTPICLTVIKSKSSKVACLISLYVACSSQVSFAQQPDPPKGLSDQVREMGAKPYSMTRYKIGDSGYFISSPTTLIFAEKAIDKKQNLIYYQFGASNPNLTTLFGGLSAPINIWRGELWVGDVTPQSKDKTDSYFAENVIQYVYKIGVDSLKDTSSPFSKTTLSPLSKSQPIFTKNPDFPKVLLSTFSTKTDSIKNGSATTEVQVIYVVAGSKIKNKKRIIFSLTLGDNQAVYALGHPDSNSKTADELINKIINSFNMKALEK